uniref:BRCT domain-containing protein n=1 Tax=Dunaliella tertiolecta TaxID=3047 RepID=A0A7S3VMZ2_DUNTE
MSATLLAPRDVTNIMAGKPEAVPDPHAKASWGELAKELSNVLRGTSLFFCLDRSAEEGGKFIDKLLRSLTQHAGQLGASVLPHYDPAHTTHVIGMHREQPEVHLAMSHGKHVANVDWFYACCEQKKCLPILEHFKPYPSAKGIPGFTQHAPDVVISGFSDIERDMVCYRVACAGGRAKRDLQPRKTSHVLVDTLGKPSKKLQIAKEKGFMGRIVLGQWLEECLRTWSVVDEGPYMERQTATGAPPTIPQHHAQTALSNSTMLHSSNGTTTAGSSHASHPVQPHAAAVAAPAATAAVAQQQLHQQQVAAPAREGTHQALHPLHPSAGGKSALQQHQSLHHHHQHQHHHHRPLRVPSALLCQRPLLL